ncbi:hypothetical protein A2U01_0098577, partial [Trifolium medium]|nr:hypothetical protein [Trifolium medium]
KIVDGGDPTKTTSDFVLELNQESAPESVVVPNVITTEGGQSVDINNSDDSHQKNASELVAVKDARTSDDQ